MNLWAGFLAALFYGSITVLGLGLVYRIFKWWMIPHIYPLTRFPSANTHTQAVGKLLADTLLFRPLWKRSQEVWVSGFMLHLCLLLILAGHYAGISSRGREFVVLGLTPAQSETVSACAGMLIGLMLMGVLLYLLVRRWLVIRIRTISTSEDYLVLLLLVGIVISGNLMRLLGGVDSRQVLDFMQGLLLFHPVAAPRSHWFSIHFVLANGLLLYFPFSKLVHSCGGFMSRWMITRTYPRQVSQR